MSITPVRYQCHVSGLICDLEELYFCDSCCTLVSKHPLATIEDIESYYCGGCLENLPSSDALANFNKCSKCFDCPVCLTTLSIFTFNPKDDESSRKYYFGCPHCRWTSKLTNLMEDSVIALSGWSLGVQAVCLVGSPCSDIYVEIVHVYMYIHIYIYTHIYILLYIHVCVYIRICIYSTYTCIYVCMYIYSIYT
jgi:hypothetical protein